MAFVLSRVIILIVWIVKWVVFKTRLFIPGLFVAVVLMFFKGWYNANEMLANGIHAILVIGVAISWIVTLTGKIKFNKRWHKRDVAYAYDIAGEPMVARKKASLN